jgi:hypothetical protein
MAHVNQMKKKLCKVLEKTGERIEDLGIFDEEDQSLRRSERLKKKPDWFRYD